MVRDVLGGGRGREILGLWRGGLDWKSRNVRCGVEGDLCRSGVQNGVVRKGSQ